MKSRALGALAVRILVDRGRRHEMRDPLLCQKRVMYVRHRAANAHGDGGFRHDDEQPQHNELGLSQNGYGM